MKRHRFFRFYIDTMRNFLRLPGLTKEALDQETANIKGMLEHDHGADRIDEKFERYVEISPPEFCAMFEYQVHSRQIIDAYVGGYDFPALTGACCLGERIFNMIIHGLRDDHKASPLYKQVYRTGSFQNWDFAIQVLREWHLAPDEVLKKLGELKEYRHGAVHYGSIVELRKKAKEAVQLALDITNGLFGMRQDVFFWSPGEPYVRLDREKDPFVRKFLLPACPRVGFMHVVKVSPEMKWSIGDPGPYEDRAISDEEFVAMRTEWLKKNV